MPRRRLSVDSVSFANSGAWDRRCYNSALPFSDMDSKVGWTVTSLEVENSILSSALRSMPPAPSAIMRELEVVRLGGFDCVVELRVFFATTTT